LHHVLRLIIAILILCSAADYSIAGVTASGGTLLRNQEYCDVLLEGIREARSSIVMSYYLFKIGTGGKNLPRRIADELTKAVRRGVSVTVILEQARDKQAELNRDNLHTAAILDQGGVKVLFDSPRVITHTKVTVIDDRYLFIGSHNLTQSALSSNNELSIRIDSPELAKEVKSFLEQL
jgi:phosphatidylserine/phosphatidylglycerophosphate/cardiolipin synthase-like enzyme